ncbi:MAG: hypothetical protein ACE5G5_14270 [Candidatus Methylomirabilales bacterium]
MLLPAMSFLTGCLIFGIIGAVVLVAVPRLQLTLRNLASFVGGAIPSATLAAFAYGAVLADSNGTLQSYALVLGFVTAVLTVGTLGGYIGVLVAERLRFGVGLSKF